MKLEMHTTLSGDGVNTNSFLPGFALHPAQG